MNNIRICTNNLVEGGSLVSSITASTAVGTLPASNLLNHKKSKVWRSTTKSSEQLITVTFLSAQTLSMAAVMFTNLSATATIKVYLYTLAGDSSPVYTSTATSILYDTLSNKSVAPLANTYSYGAGAQGVVYFPERTVAKIAIGITDTSNTASYLQVGNLVIGKYWTPVLNFERNPSVQIVDESKRFRTDSGDLYSDEAFRFRRISFRLSNMQSADRDSLLGLLRMNGVTYPVFLSLFPADTDTQLEALYCMQAVLENINAIDRPLFNRYAMPLIFIEI
jgi:hypothetical protein